MPVLSTAAEVDVWLAEAGWHPGRDVGEEARDAVAAVIERYRSYGVAVEPSAPALAFIREHAFLRAVIDTAPENFAIFTPRLVFKGDAEEISELAGELGTKLFPVGYDTYDGSTVLIDETGRFFLSHHTGAYWLGCGKYEALMSLTAGDMDDAEDYFVRSDCRHGDPARRFPGGECAQARRPEPLR
ncbi:SUKH-3 domain-containing protein [Streptomyces sp. NPDC059863]|uniref:SUKH-3 domain-containing protein n=1 Tax=unclassified Streptomyces TaxID=2593676 RepID=UPI003659B04D